MKSALFGIGVAIVSALAAIAAASAAWVFWEAWKGSDREAFRALLGAFSGAFFAFLFLRFGDSLRRIYERKEKHHTALVRLQHYFNDCLNATGDNVFIADDCISVFNEARLQSGDRPIFMSQFQEYAIDRELPIGLTNIEFLNEVYTLNVELRKLNDSMATVDRAYAQVREAFLAKRLELPDYLANARLTRKRYLEMKEFLLQTKRDLIRLFATSNLLLKDAPFLVRVIRALTKSSYPKDFKKRLTEETSRVSQEMDGLAIISAERINEVQRRVTQPGAAVDRPQATGG